MRFASAVTRLGLAAREKAAVPVLLVLVFLVSRLVYWFMGVRFDVTTLTWYFQYLDTPLLQDDLLRSSFFLHGQPPMFNLFLGAILKAFPGGSAYAFHLCFMFAGLLMYGAAYSLLKKFTGKKWLAFALATLFVTSPEILIYENWLFYSYFVCVLLTLAAWSLQLYLSTQRLGYGSLFFGLLGVLCLTRTSFHLIYLLWCVFLVCRLLPVQWKTVVRVALPAILLVTGLYVKNAYLFGNFGSSSWLGMNLWNIARTSYSKNELKKLKGQGTIPAFISKNTAWSRQLDSYPQEFLEVPRRFKGVPVLNQVRKKSGARNFHHFGYVALSEEFLDVSLTTIRRKPARYVGSVMTSWAIYFSSSVEFPHLEKNRERVQPLMRWRGFLFDRGKIDLRSLRRWLPGLRTSGTVPLFSLVFFPGIILAGGWIGLSRRISSWGIPKHARGVCLFCVCTIVYVSVLGNAVEQGENFRFRFVTGPLYFVVLSVCTFTCYRRFRLWRAQLSGTQSESRLR